MTYVFETLKCCLKSPDYNDHSDELVIGKIKRNGKAQSFDYCCDTPSNISAYNLLAFSKVLIYLATIVALLIVF